MKIRCRNRRTSASARRQSIWRQRSASSSGPLTTTAGAVAASSLSFGSGVSVIFLFTGSPDRVSTLSSPGTRPGIRPVIQGRPAGGASHHVPVSCRLSAAGIRFSVIRFPPRDRLSSRSAHRPTSGRTQTGLPRSARTSCDRGGCPLYPEDDGAHPAGSPPRPAPAASQRQVPSTPPTTSHRREAPLHEASNRGSHHVHPSGLPLAHAPRMEPAALRLPPELRTLPSPATHVRGRDRPSSTDLELPLNSHSSISNPVVHSMRATSRRTANLRARDLIASETCALGVAVCPLPHDGPVKRLGRPAGVGVCLSVCRDGAARRYGAGRWPGQIHSSRGLRRLTRGVISRLGRRLRRRWPLRHLRPAMTVLRRLCDGWEMVRRVWLRGRRRIGCIGRANTRRGLV